MSGRLKILIIGGYGTFGGRLARLLAGESGVGTLIAGRSRDKAARFCETYLAGADAMPAVFDRDGDVAEQLAGLGPDIVVDASGPFQDYPGDPYRLVRACIAHGMDYIDIADATDFVTGIVRFDDDARRHGCFALSGASTYPVLSAAVIRRLAQPMTRVETITAGIAPSPFARFGQSVIRAAIGYGGKPVALIRGGRPATGYALAETRRSTVAPPGRLPLANRLFSLVDVPDFRILPALWPGLTSIWLGFGPAPELAQRGLNFCAWLVRLKLLPSLKHFAPVFARTANLLRWGEARSGMFVAVGGILTDGTRCERSWHLTAEGDDGPFIPSMAVAAVVRRCLAGRRPEPGARPATGDVKLADYEALFRRFAIHAGEREIGPLTASMPLYRRILAGAWDELPGPVRALHDLDGTMVAQGRAHIDRGNGMLARCAGMLFGFPAADRDVPVAVSFTAQGGREIWHRTFAGRSFKSLQWQGQGRSAYLIKERIGPVTVALALVVERNRLNLIVRRWSLLGIPMPAALAPAGDAYEHAEGGRFHFHVEITHPFTGLIVRYRGWLEPQPAAASGVVAPVRPSAPGTLS